MAPTTSNKPCAQHTEISGAQPGHTSRTVTQPPPPPPPPIKERIPEAPQTLKTEKCLGGGWAGGDSAVSQNGADSADSAVSRNGVDS